MGKNILNNNSLSIKQNNSMKSLPSIIYKVTITAETGLHIGGGDASIEIGGMDNAVIKDKNDYPYIPGSSLKGKMRSLLEVKEGNFNIEEGNDKGGPHKFGSEKCLGVNCLICRAFGSAGTDKKNNKDQEKKLKDDLAKIGPTRMIVRDLFLSEDDKDENGEIIKKGSKAEFDEMIENGENPLEEKTEVSINRETGTAMGSGPRTLERVPAGTVFEGKIIFRVFEIDDKGERDEAIAEELFGKENLLKKLIENDYLGGLGSRGSGQITIEFRDEKDEKK